MEYEKVTISAKKQKRDAALVVVLHLVLSLGLHTIPRTRETRKNCHICMQTTCAAAMPIAS